jgi:hypothetical protein
MKTMLSGKVITIYLAMCPLNVKLGFSMQNAWRIHIIAAKASDKHSIGILMY